MIELTYLIAALAAGKLGGLDGHALHGHGRLFIRERTRCTVHSPVSMYVVPPDSAFSKEAEGADDEVELLRGDGQRGLQLISLCDLADMMAEQAPGRIRLAFRS